MTMTVYLIGEKSPHQERRDLSLGLASNKMEKTKTTIPNCDVILTTGMLEVTTAQRLTMLNAVNRIQQDIKRSISVLKYDRFLADAQWSVVQEMTRITYPYKEYPRVNDTLEYISLRNLC